MLCPCVPRTKALFSIVSVASLHSIAPCLLCVFRVSQEQDKSITLKRFEFERECKELHNQYEERMKVGVQLPRVSCEPRSTTSIGGWGPSPCLWGGQHPAPPPAVCPSCAHIWLCVAADWCGAAEPPGSP